MSRQYLLNERRHNYTTPKSFLELIALYTKLLRVKHTDLMSKMVRLENGLEKLESTAQQVCTKAELSIKFYPLLLELHSINFCFGHAFF